MFRRLRFSACLATVVIASAFGSGTAEEQGGPAKDVPELKVLEHFVGVWDVAITSKGGPFVRGQAEAKWILDGRFVQQTGSLTSEDGATTLRITSLMTYDATENVYRTWTFVSNGATTESKGHWDAEKKTMTSTRRNGVVSTTTTASFAEPGAERWSIVSTNENNEVLSEMAGINSRRKP